VGRSGASPGVTERLRVDPSLVRASSAVALPREAAHHLRVARVPWGTRVVLFDGEGCERDAVLDPGGATVTPCDAPRAGVGADGARVTWIQGYPKGDKLDVIIRQATELGVAAIWPVFTARSVPQERGDRSAARLERWRRIAEEAARQCGRADVPALRGPTGLDEALAALPPGGLRIVAWESSADALARVLPPGAGGPVAALAGPEGGLDRAEVDRCAERGFIPVSLGPRILRAETVAPALLGALSVLCGDLAAR
jgi:16S rRNA (uracil1498-N3)-methyltransferase